ncbi:MAG: hypothetical protein GY847_30850, partial [Proteobacteria bacterium]|nr:hypothetical protein [Pseudomonadota bacterium]
AYPEAFPIDFDIELSMDGSDWSVVGGHRNFAVESSDIVEILFPATEAAAVRLRVLRSYRHESDYHYAGVSEMAVYEVSERHDVLDLKFTAPGDDPGWGESTAYDIRYSKTLITEENFSGAIPLEAPLPGGSGVLEKVLVEDLEAETEYYFALYAFDEAGNRSPLSNVARGSTIVVPPGVITDLEIAAVDADEVTLRWTAPGDNGYEGQAAQYDIRWCAEQITAGNFELAGRVIGAPIPRIAGSDEEMYIVNLQDAFESARVAECSIDDDSDYSGSCTLPTECTLNNGSIPSSCGKIEGSQIGEVGIVINIGSVKVTIYEWIAKDGGSGEFIGFKYNVEDGEVFVSVKAGRDSHMEHGDGVWMHPEGTSGHKAKAISNVVFCSCDDDDDTNSENDGCGPSIIAVIRDFSSAHPDFEAYSGSAETTGLVGSQLGIGNKPVFADTHGSGLFGQQLTSEESFNQWYRDVEGVNHTVKYEIQLSDIGGGYWEYDNSSFFPLTSGDGFGNQGNPHNFHFTTEIHVQFK